MKNNKLIYILPMLALAACGSNDDKENSEQSVSETQTYNVRSIREVIGYHGGGGVSATRDVLMLSNAAGRDTLTNFVIYLQVGRYEEEAMASQRIRELMESGKVQVDVRKDKIVRVYPKGR